MRIFLLSKSATTKRRLFAAIPAAIQGDYEAVPRYASSGFTTCAASTPSEPLVEVLEAVGELVVIDPQRVEDRGVEVVHMHRVAHDVVGKVVGLAMDDAAFDPAAASDNSLERIITDTSADGPMNFYQVEITKP